MKTDITQLKKDCYLYIWLTQFLSNTTEEERVKLENKQCGRRIEDYEKIQFQLDIFNTYKTKFNLDKYESSLLEEIKKQMSFKNRKNLDVSKLKTDVCEFLLRLDNPLYNGKECQSMTSILYTEYQNVKNRLDNKLTNLLENTQDLTIYELANDILTQNQSQMLTKKKVK